MPTVRLIHWNEAESQACLRKLRDAGYSVEYDPPDPQLLKAWKRRPPEAFVIDLSRLPSSGRDMAVALRAAKSTRQVPLVFVEGEPAKLAKIQRLLPDATYTSWRSIRGAMKCALALRHETLFVPQSQLAGYSQTRLPKKLGIKANSKVVLIGAPDGFERTLGELPSGAQLRRQGRGRRDLTIWFVPTLHELEQRIDRFAEQVGKGGLWIAWPKKASGVVTDVTQGDIRQQALAAGLVDYKVCAIDAVWSGLKFATRKPN